MKLTKARIWQFNSGGLSPVLLELTTDSGITGLGEAGVAYGLGSATAAPMIQEMVHKHLSGGADPMPTERIWTEIYDTSFWAKGGGPFFFAGLSAVEQALIDIKARALNVPVYELLGGRVRDTLRCYSNGWYFGAKSDDDLPGMAEATVRDGYKAIKFYPFVTILPTGRLKHPVRRGTDAPDIVPRALKNLAAVRSAVGDDVEIMVDLASALSPDDTIRFCREADRYGLSFVEEPCEPGDIQTLRKIADAIPQRLAVGERLYTRYGFRNLLESRCVDILQPDIGNTGGILEARKIAAMGEAYSLKVQPHICASPLSTAIGMHFSASIPNFYFQEHFPYWDRIDGYRQVLKNPVEATVTNGAMPVSDAPGYGVELDHDALSDSLFQEINL